MADTPHVHAVLSLAPVVCEMCGVVFAIPRALHDKLVAFRATVCCPSGHVRPIAAPPPHARKIEQLEQLVALHIEQLMQAKAEIHKLRSTHIDRLVGPETAPEAS